MHIRFPFYLNLSPDTSFHLTFIIWCARQSARRHGYTYKNMRSVVSWRGEGYSVITVQCDKCYIHINRPSVGHSKWESINLTNKVHEVRESRIVKYTKYYFIVFTHEANIKQCVKSWWFEVLLRSGILDYFRLWTRSDLVEAPPQSVLLLSLITQPSFSGSPQSLYAQRDLCCQNNNDQVW